MENREEEIVEKEFSNLQIIPNKDMFSGVLDKVFFTMLRDMDSEIKELYDRDIETNVSINTSNLVSYEVFLSKQNISFTFAIPCILEKNFTNKLTQVWKGCEIATCEDKLEEFKSVNVRTAKLCLKNDSFMSLKLAQETSNRPSNVRMRNRHGDEENPNNDFLSSYLQVTSSLRQDEKVALQIMMQPINDKWQDKADKKLKKYQKGEVVSVENGNTIWKICDFIFVDLLEKFMTLITEVFDSILGVNTKPQSSKSSQERLKVTNKTEKSGFRTDIRIHVYSKDPLRRDRLLQDTINCFKTTKGDNELIVHKTWTGDRFVNRNFKCKGAKFDPTSILVDNELQQMLELPNGHSQTKHKQMVTIDANNELPPLKKIKDGIPYATTYIKGKLQEIRWGTSEDDICQALIYLTKQGGGKTSALQNRAINAHRQGHPVIYIDNVENCKYTRQIQPYIDPEKLEIFDLGDLSKVWGLGYNENYQYLKGDDKVLKMQVADNIGGCTKDLLESIRSETTEPMSNRMLKYWKSASRLAFCYEGATVSDVGDILSNVEIRNTWINKAVADELVRDKDVQTLRELDNIVKKKGKNELTGETIHYTEVDGNKDNLVAPILDRLATLENLNMFVAEMFSNPITPSLDFNRIIDEGKVAIIRIPQDVFKDEMIRDILTTFFMTKIWDTVVSRKKRIPVHVILDEVAMIPNTTLFLAKHITEFRRHRLAMCFGAHNLEQFKKALKNINTSGANIIVLKGAKQETIKTIEGEMGDFSYRDIQNMEQWHGLCMVNYDNHMYRFIAKLDKPIVTEEVKKMVERGEI